MAVIRPRQRISQWSGKASANQVLDLGKPSADEPRVVGACIRPGERDIYGNVPGERVIQSLTGRGAAGNRPKEPARNNLEMIIRVSALQILDAKECYGMKCT